MNISDIIQIISTSFILVGIFVSLYIGVRSINLTRKVEERREKNQLLDTIEKWGVEIYGLYLEDEPAFLYGDRDADKSWPFLDKQLPKMGRLQLMLGKGVMVSGIAKSIHETLVNVVDNSVEALTTQIGYLQQYKDFIEFRDKTGPVRTEFLTKLANDVYSQRATIQDSAIYVIDQVTKIGLGLMPKSTKNIRKKYK